MCRTATASFCVSYAASLQSQTARVYTVIKVHAWLHSIIIKLCGKTYSLARCCLCFLGRHISADAAVLLLMAHLASLELLLVFEHLKLSGGRLKD